VRNTLFRGQKQDSNEWVEGSLIKDVFYPVGDFHCIPYILNVKGLDNFDCWEDLDDDYGIYRVKSETVGEYTGLTDKNGKKIFEGDIVKDFDKNRNYLVRFQAACWMLENNGNWEFLGDRVQNYMHNCPLEVIGNIYDNPELRRMLND